jgi:YesN/AraC family two-component response regulator
MVVKYELEKLGLTCTTVEIGWAEILEPASFEQLNEFRTALFAAGLELIDDKRNFLIEKIKNIILNVVNFSDTPIKINFSFYLSNTLNLDYTYLANVFSSAEGCTIENYFILSRIERVKQLLDCSDLTLTEISLKLHYSSVAHLSTQFKKVTGLTPTCFKNTIRLSA